jgi:two-component system sensor histidine kinase KdpD
MNTDENIRPNPDELLASIKQEEESHKHGKLKIFFGMCAGVGKTYTMLQAAIIDRKKGIDIVIGYIEPHERPETLELIEGFEVIGRKKIEYKGMHLEEVDTDEIIRRRPQIVLIDELAHTNCPGSRHTKRYQDVQEILDSGIDVYTTVNVQHLESRSDTVTQITGITIRETLPDEIFEKAAEVELVDLTPDELLERLSEGKVYTSERSAEAIRNFFRKGNITALREMSLRLVADRVDKQLRDYMHLKGISGPWKSGLHLMVIIGPGLQSVKLIRWAKNLSYTMGASLVALYVESPKRLTLNQKEQLTKNINLAKQLGAEFITTSDNDLVKGILRVALKENITHIIVGKPRRRNLFSLLILGNFIQKLVRYSGNIDVYVLGSDHGSEGEYMRYMSQSTYYSSISQYLLSIVIVGLISLIFYPLSAHIGYQVVSFVLLFVVSIMATFLGTGPILMASTLCALIWDYFFIPPRYTFHIGSTEDMLMLGMFFFIALVNGVLTSRVRRQEQLTRDREERTYSFFELTKGLSQAAGLQEVIRVAIRNIKKYFVVDAYFVLQDGSGSLKLKDIDNQGLKFTENDFSIATWTYKNGRKAGKFTETLPSSDYTFFPLTGTSVKPGVAVIKLPNWFTGYKELQWDTFLSQISAAIEREFLDELAKKAQVLDESDKLYKTLFNTISHELRIPVATIMGAADSLVSTGHNKEVKNELSLEIIKASERLNRLIENLLSMSRLESGRITPRMDWCDVHDLVNRVTDSLRNELAPFNPVVVIPENMPLVKLDFGLMEQVLHNLVYNACQYATKSSNLRIKMFYDHGNFILEVMDRGPGFPREALPHIFDKFYRVEGSKAGGTGLGLSIVKGFVEAQKGTVSVENRKNGGARFTIRIPSEIPKIENLP